MKTGSNVLSSRTSPISSLANTKAYATPDTLSMPSWTLNGMRTEVQNTRKIQLWREKQKNRQQEGTVQSEQVRIPCVSVTVSDHVPDTLETVATLWKETWLMLHVLGPRLATKLLRIRNGEGFAGNTMQLGVATPQGP